MTDQTQPPQPPPLPQQPPAPALSYQHAAPPQQQPYYPPQQAAPQQRQYQNGVGLAALIVAIIGLLMCWIPIVNYVSVVLGVIGLVLAIVGFVNVRRGVANNPVVAIVAGILSVVAIVVPWVIMALFLNAVDEGVDGFTEYTKCLESAGEDPTKIAACEIK